MAPDVLDRATVHGNQAAFWARVGIFGVGALVCGPPLTRHSGRAGSGT